MKTFYGVLNTYNDKGIVNTQIITTQAEEMPASSFKETRRADIYTDWFETYDEAEKFSSESLLA